MVKVTRKEKIDVRYTLKTLTYFGRGFITVWLTSCLFCLDSTALLLLNK